MVMRESKDTNEIALNGTEKRLNNLEKQDKQSEEQKKRLKRKVRIRNCTIVALIVIIIILLLRSCGSDNPIINRIPILEDSDLVKQTTEPTEIPRIDIPVVTDCTVSADQPYINFYNPDTNADKYYLQYEVYDENNQIVYQSKMVEAGKKFSADIYSAFSGVAGSYYVNVKVRTFKVGSLTEVNGINNDVVITVK